MKHHTNMRNLILTGLLLGLALLVCLPVAGEETGTAAKPGSALSMLVYSRTAGYRHKSIEDGVKMLGKLCAENGYTMRHTEDPALFNDEELAKYTVVIFLNTSKDVLDDTQQEAFIRYIRGGGGYVGVHAASDTEFDWPWYGKLVGAYFTNHPKIQSAEVKITAPDHACTHGLPNPWTRTDEWYNFRDVQPGLTILCEVDESTYEGGTMGASHPISWCQEFDGGRAFYTAMGHTPESYTEPAFVEHVHRGIRWAAGVEAE